MVNKGHYLADPCTVEFWNASSIYDDAIVDCCEKNGFSNLWTMFALSSVLRRYIVSMYPYMNGDTDYFAMVCNRTLKPVLGEHTLVGQEPLYIMWSRTIPPPQTATVWVPNHFVALYESEYAASTTVANRGQARAPGVVANGSTIHDDHRIASQVSRHLLPINTNVVPFKVVHPWESCSAAEGSAATAPPSKEKASRNRSENTSVSTNMNPMDSLQLLSTATAGHTQPEPANILEDIISPARTVQQSAATLLEETVETLVDLLAVENIQPPPSVTVMQTAKAKPCIGYLGNSYRFDARGL